MQAHIDTQRAAVAPKFDRIPADLKLTPAWLVWRYEPGEKKPRKVPYYVSGERRNGEQGSAVDRAKLATFDDAVNTVPRGYDGIGLAMLADAGLVALDFDDCISLAGELLPDVRDAIEGTYAERSPSGRGVRAFFRGNVRDRKDTAPAAGLCRVEFFHGSGFVTVTGDVLPDNELFGWTDLTDLSPSALALYHQRFNSPALADEGDALVSIAPKVGLTIERALECLANLDPDMGYDDWLRVGQALHHEFSGATSALDAWDGWSHDGAKYAGRRELESKWRSFGNYRGAPVTAASLLKMAGVKSAAAYSELTDRTDTGNANLLRQLTAGDLRFVPERRSWMRWDGSCWTVDETGALAQRESLRVAEFYLGTADGLERQAGEPALVDDERKRIAKAAKAVRDWATHCRNRRAIEAMLAIASRDPRMMVHAADLDRDPWLLGVLNGVVDLRSGALRPAGRDDLVTKRASVRYAPNATAPRWRRFIDEITGEPLPAIEGAPVGRFKRRPDLARYLQLAAGYSITGSTEEQKMFMPVGNGSNGKNIMLDTLQTIAGDYWRTVPPEALMATRHDADAERPSPTAASLAGARAAISSESRDGQRLDVALVKRHTGGGFMVARLLRENSFRFEITHKLWLMTNHRPALDHMDDAVRGRLHLIPFDRVWNRPGHPERDPSLPDGDKGLMEALRSEAEGILAWLVEGAMAYKREGLNPPAAVVQMTRDYFAEMDCIGRWLDTCQRCPPKEGMRTSELFERFRTWCAFHGIKDTRSLKAFSMALASRGIAKAETSSGVHFGLRA